MDPNATKVKLWESLRNDARHDDAAIEQRLATLEKLALSEAPDASTQRRFKELSQEVEEQVRKMQSLVMSMGDVVKGLPSSSGPIANSTVESTLAMQRHTQRFEEIVAEKINVIRRLANDFNKRRERSELLGKVHREINVYQESEEMRHLATENDSLKHTQRRLNDILAQADMNRERLKEQRNAFLGIADKALTIAEKVPFINGLLKKIDAKRRRDVIIVALVISVCMFLVVLFW